MALSPDGKTLASGGDDDVITLWDVEARQRIGQPLEGHVSGVSSIAFSPDAKSLAAGDGAGTVILWDVDLESWLTRACVIANRNLTQEEWERFMGDEPYRATCPNAP